MAVHFTAAVYGLVFAQPPFQNASGATAFSNVQAFPAQSNINFPTDNTVVHSLPNGYVVGNTYVYSVIEVLPSGANHNSTKYASSVAAATLASNIG